MRDVSGSWAAGAVEEAVSLGYVKGYPDGMFKPDAGVTRAEFVAIVDNAFRVAPGQVQPVFTDVHDGDWFAPDVKSARAAGFVSGYPDGTFQPQHPVTRQEAACQLGKLLRLNGTGSPKVADAGQIDSWAQSFVAQLLTKGILTGYPDGTFRPNKVISRAEAVAMINKALASQTHTTASTLSASLPAPAQAAAAASAATTAPVTVALQVADDTVNIRSGPGTDQPVIGQVHQGDILQARSQSGTGWYQVDFQGGTGWVANWCVQATEVSPSSSPAIGCPQGAAAPDASRGTAPDVVSIARRFLGRPYCYGAEGPNSFDCSGFVHYVYSLAGIDLPRTAADQAQAGKRVSTPAPGDLVFFSDSRSGYITHVGIYIGNNSFINADNGGVTIRSLDGPWYSDRYVMACKIE